MYAIRSGEDLRAVPGAAELPPRSPQLTGEVAAQAEARKLDSRSVHMGAARATAAAYAALMLVYWITFGGNRTAAFMVAISTVYVLMFFGVPWFAVRSRDAFLNSGAAAGRQRSFSDFLEGEVDTATGSCSGREAMVQILTVPLCLLAATVAFAVIWVVI